MNARESGVHIPERPRIETIPQAAEAIAKLYGTLGGKAKTLTNGYLERQTLGEEGTTWDYGTHAFARVKIPRLHQALVHGDTVLLGGVLLRDTNKLVSPYLLHPLEHSKDDIVLEETGWTKDSGFGKLPSAYIAKPSGSVLEITVSQGKVNLQQMIQVNDGLRTLLDRVQAYKNNL